MKKITTSILALALCMGITSCGEKKANSETKESSIETRSDMSEEESFLRALPKSKEDNPVFLTLDPTDVILDVNLIGKVEVVKTPMYDDIDFYTITSHGDFNGLDFRIALKPIAPMDDAELQGNFTLCAMPLDENGDPIEEQKGDNDIYWYEEQNEYRDVTYYRDFFGMKNESNGEANFFFKVQSHTTEDTPWAETVKCFKQAYDELQKVRMVKIYIERN